MYSYSRSLSNSAARSFRMEQALGRCIMLREGLHEEVLFLPLVLPFASSTRLGARNLSVHGYCSRSTFPAILRRRCEFIRIDEINTKDVLSQIGIVALNFAYVDEASMMLDIVNPIVNKSKVEKQSSKMSTRGSTKNGQSRGRKLTKSLIGAPTNFQHIVHMGPTQKVMVTQVKYVNNASSNMSHQPRRAPPQPPNVHSLPAEIQNPMLGVASRPPLPASKPLLASVIIISSYNFFFFKYACLLECVSKYKPKTSKAESRWIKEYNSTSATSNGQHTETIAGTGAAV